MPFFVSINPKTKESGNRSKRQEIMKKICTINYFFFLLQEEKKNAVTEL